MAGPTLSERVLILERDSSSLVARADALRSNFERAADRIETAIGANHDVDTRLVRVEEELRRIKERVDEISTRRWDLFKIILVATLGAVLTFAGYVGKAMIDRSNGLEKTAPSPPPALPDKN